MKHPLPHHLPTILFAPLLRLVLFASLLVGVAAGVAEPVFAHPGTPNVVTIVELDWVLIHSTIAADPTGTHNNAIEELSYFGGRPASGTGGKLNRVGAMMQTPTAVTLVSFDAKAGTSTRSVLAWLLLLALLIISRLVMRWKRLSSTETAGRSSARNAFRND